MSNPEPRSGEMPRLRYLFGEFTLDLERGTLGRGGEDVALRPKSFEVLTYMVKHHGKLVAKSTLMGAVWPDTAVGDNSLAQCLLDIRRALGDDSQQLIRTVARRGYVFTASVTTAVVEIPCDSGPLQVQPPPRTYRKVIIAACALPLIAIVAAIPLWPPRPVRQDLTYEQITNFTDSAVSPALSPDGRMVAFIRSDSWWQTPDQIYVKLLPNGEPVQVAHDPRPKYGLSFSPDGSRIAYTVFDSGWRAVTVSPLGGEPSELLNNASGVTWLDARRILFSEVRPIGSIHMGIVTANQDRSDQRTVYFPQDKRGMVHLSFASPDRKWALALEMNPVWQPCRVIPVDGSAAGRHVGPKGNCTSAAWSPDGKWMYFGVGVGATHHLWRQRFPDGEPEQITSGPTEEDGVAVAPDGASLITSIGLRQSALWIHDARGDRPLSSQGYVRDLQSTGLRAVPTFSRDGQAVFYLRSESPQTAPELWRADVKSGKNEALLPGLSMSDYDISTDGKEVVFSVKPEGKPFQIWLAALDRSSPARLISSSGEDSPYFGPDGQILYRIFDGTKHYLGQMNRDGSGRSKATPYDVGSLGFISPDRRWITLYTTASDGVGGSFAMPVSGGIPRRICSGCVIMWAPDGKFLYLDAERGSEANPGKMRVFPLSPGEMLPKLPAFGMARDDPKLFPGSRLISGCDISPGPDPSVFAYVKTTVHRNLFRIPLPK